MLCYILFTAWNDIRTVSTVDAILAKVPDQNKNYLKSISGLPISPYFSALKMRWMKDNIKNVRRASRDKRLMFGTVDSWIVWVSSYIRLELALLSLAFTYRCCIEFASRLCHCLKSPCITSRRPGDI